MGKVVRGVLQAATLVAAVAATIATGGAGSPTILAALAGSQTAAAAIVVGLGLLNAALAPRAPKVPTAQRDRLFASIDPSTPRKIVFGPTAMAVEIR